MYKEIIFVFIGACTILYNDQGLLLLLCVNKK